MAEVARYSPDHKFSEVVSECFGEIGEHMFRNPISSYPWGGRNRVIARIKVFEKYLKGDDVITATWMQRQAVLKDSSWRGREVGIEYLITLLDERSAGQWREEMDLLQAALPTLLDYMKAEWGYPTAEQFATWRRAKMHVVKSPPKIIAAEPQS